MFVIANVKFKSKEPLESVGAILSAVLLNGSKFKGRNEYIRDEVPAVYVDSPILGFRIVLMEEDVGEYHLELTPTIHASAYGKYSVHDLGVSETVDISAHIAFVLKQTSGIYDVVEDITYFPDLE